MRRSDSDSRNAVRRRGIGWVVALAAGVSLTACEKEPTATPPTGGSTPAATPPRTGTSAAPVVPATSGSPAGTEPQKPPRAQKPLAVELPPAAPLTDDAARRILLDAIDISSSGELARAALLALAGSAGPDAVRAAAAKFLAKGDGAGGYDDPDGAATAIEALLRAGDATAAQSAVALARSGIEQGDLYDSYATMLAAVKGPLAPEAQKLLVQLAADPDLYVAAIPALAPLREPTAATRLHEIATDVEQETALRASAAAGLLALNDPRATAVLTALVNGTEGDEALNSFDVMDGLALEGVPEALPWIRKIADPIIAEDLNSEIEIRSLVGAYADIRGPGNGTKDDIAALRALLGKSHGMADDEIVASLYALGDDQQAEPAANILAACVKDMSTRVVDEEAGVRLLEAIAARGAAGSSVFGTAVNAAAAVQVPKDTTRQDATDRAWRLRVAAAHAYLAGKKR